MSTELVETPITILPSLEITFDDHDPVEIPIRVRGKDGTIRNYLLKEGMEEVNCKYQNFMTSQHKIGTDGTMMSLGNIADAEPYLVHLCLFELIPSKDNPGYFNHKQVSLAIVRSWPADRVKKLYETAKKINHIDDTETVESLREQRDKLDKRIAVIEKKDEQVKNDQGATTNTSE